MLLSQKNGDYEQAFITALKQFTKYSLIIYEKAESRLRINFDVRVPTMRTETSLMPSNICSKKMLLHFKSFNDLLLQD